VRNNARAPGAGNDAAGQVDDLCVVGVDGGDDGSLVHPCVRVERNTALERADPYNKIAAESSCVGPNALPVDVETYEQTHAPAVAVDCNRPRAWQHAHLQLLLHGPPLAVMAQHSAIARYENGAVPVAAGAGFHAGKDAADNIHVKSRRRRTDLGKAGLRHHAEATLGIDLICARRDVCQWVPS
jgi:hypothetical protein